MAQWQVTLTLTTPLGGAFFTLESPAGMSRRGNIGCGVRTRYAFPPHTLPVSFSSLCGGATRIGRKCTYTLCSLCILRREGKGELRRNLEDVDKASYLCPVCYWDWNYEGVAPVHTHTPDSIDSGLLLLLTN